ncbi:TonB-dependent receptor, partial [Methylobacterium sp. A52T]
LYATDTLDVTDRLSLTGGFRLNYARIQTRDQTGFSPGVTRVHEDTKVNPPPGPAYQSDPARGGPPAPGLAAAGRAPAGAPFVMGYDPPFAIPFLRRNEVAVRLPPP